jgi:methionine aminopeptidase
MANSFDSRIKLLEPADAGTIFTADTVALDAPFDVRANIEVGAGIHGFTVDQTIAVSVVNVSKTKTVAQQRSTRPLPPGANEFNDVLVVPILSGWGALATDAEVGDVLEVVASYVVNAGINTDYSTAQSQRFGVVK